MNNLKDENTVPFLMLQHQVIDDKHRFENAEEKMIYIILKRHANMDGANAFPSIKTIAEKVPCSERTVTRRIDNMVKTGLIRKEPRFDEGGKQTSNVYTITSWGCQPDRVGVSGCQGEGVRLADELYPFNYIPLSNATTTATGSNLRLVDSDYLKVQDAYMMAGWGLPNAFSAQKIKHDLEDHSADVIVKAIEIAGLRNASGYGYTKSILDEWGKHGVETTEQVERYEAAKSSNRTRRQKGERNGGTNQNAEYIKRLNQGVEW